MITINGHYFSGIHPIAMDAELEVAGTETALHTETASETYATQKLKASPRIGLANRFITFPDGGQFLCRDSSTLDLFSQECASEGLISWLEKQWIIALTCIIMVVAVLAGAYLVALPAAVEHIACRIPMETEKSLGTTTLAWLDKHKLFEPSTLPAGKQQEIKATFQDLCPDTVLKPHYCLEFRSARAIGPNAFAFPGGTIVITDQMVGFCESLEETMAVLAHEVGHIELRHTMRNILQNSAIGIITATITSDASTFTTAITGLPILIVQAKYSRDFENAADTYAFSLMKSRGYSPKAFAFLMTRLSEKNGSSKNRNPLSWLSTHPVTSKRITRALDAAAPANQSPAPAH